MKIRNAIKLAATGALAAAPLAAFAGAPANFGNYAIGSGGLINSSVAGCASTGVDEAGFTQERCTIGGKTYIHTIVDEATGGEHFIDENFVEMGGTGGIASKQKLTETSGTQTFTNTAQLSTGSFFSAGTEARIALDQGVSDSGSQPFNTDFRFREGKIGGGTDGIGLGFTGLQSDAVITDMQMNTTISEPGAYTGGFSFENRNVEGSGATNTTLGAADANTVNGTRVDQLSVLNDSASSITQNFTLRERHGSFTSGPGNVGLSGSTVTWAAGDSIINTKIGQTIAGAGVFGLHDFKNETQGTGTGVDSQTSALPGTFYQPVFTDGSDPFAAFSAATTPTQTF